ncbi:MAG: PAQR family membrane homeostasis protein TrhA [Gemmatimonadota bacterium]
MTERDGTGSQAEPPARPMSREEVANLVTHGIGMVAAIVGAAVLVVLAALHGDVWEIVGVSVFATSLVALYTASTLYHAARDPVLKARLKVLDHAAIYLLIAGSYTPFMIGELRGGWGWSLFGVIWGLAVAGIGLKLAFIGRFRLLSTIVYVAMGWLVLVAVVPLVRNLEPVTLAWLVAGGIAYTAGTPFYHNRRIRYSHAIWHVFVMAGSACHAIAVVTVV